MILKDKVAIVTGGASGMGKDISILYAREGAKVLVADINLDGAKETVAKIEKDGGVGLALKVDVSKQEDIDKMVDTAMKEFGDVDILVNNAGIMDNMEPAADITDEQWERVFAINTTSVMRATRKVIPIFLKKEAGIIINIASIGGLIGKVAGSIYTASKHAVIGFTKSTGYMYANKGIRCNAIAPGAVSTNIGSTMTNINQFGMQRTGLGMQTNPRTGEAAEIAGVALFLASPESSFVNGTVITADGGWTA